MELRAATAQDLDAIFAIYDPEVLHGICTFETTPKSPEERLAWFRAHTPPRYPLIVAEERGVVLGWAGLSAWSARAAYARAAENSVYVASSARGRRVGSLLLRALIDGAHRPETGLGVLVARIVAGNPASIRLHEAAGFRTIGVMRRIGEKFGRVLDVVMMDLHLDAAGSVAEGPAEGSVRA